MRTAGLILAVGGSLSGFIDVIDSSTFLRVLGSDWSEVHITLQHTADWPWAVIIAGAIVVAVEVAKVLTGRSRAVDDVLPDTAGGAVGARLGVLVVGRLARRREADAGAGAVAAAKRHAEGLRRAP